MEKQVKKETKIGCISMEIWLLQRLRNQECYLFD